VLHHYRGKKEVCLTLGHSVWVAVLVMVESISMESHLAQERIG
jgi:hypothetical protein